MARDPIDYEALRKVIFGRRVALTVFRAKPWGILEYQETQLPLAPEDGDVVISTIRVGLLFIGFTGAPRFETKVFGGAGTDQTRRYSTEQEAKAGHELMAQKICLSMAVLQRRN